MPDTVIGPYRVLDKLGEGGMGEVYRGRDTRLNRDVALKWLPSALADDPDRIARLRREAQALAALNHPNVAHVYALEESGASLVLVMELVPGPTLADLLARSGQPPTGLPIDQAIAIARQIAEGLEAAHEAGIVHRDLKPSNVKVRDDGTVKVLDFGLAKSIASDRLQADVAVSPSLPTLTSPAMTAMGIIMGTAAYISPEQAKGRPADKRADIWAFGCVLWEMLTGTSLFARETMSETLAAVLKDAPPFEQLPADVPPAVRHLLERCLARDPRQRLRDIGEARIALSAPLQQYHDRPARTGSSRLWPLIAAVAAAIAIAAAGAAWRFSKPAPLPVKRLDLPVEIGSRVFALSPDGQRIAYVSAGHLFVRSFDALDAADLGAGPPDINYLIWSSDSSTVVFSGGGSIQSMPASGGSVFTVCRIPASGRVMGMSWVPATSSIAFSVWRDSLYTVPASGGTPAVLVPLNSQTEVDFHTVNALPDGRLIVDTHERASDVAIVELIGGGHRSTLSSDSKLIAIAVSGDRALFLRVDVNPGLWTAPFRNNTVDFPHATLIQANAVAYDVSSNGSVVAQVPAVSIHEFASVDAKGTISGLPGAAVEGDTPPALALSPDGHRAAFVAGPLVGNLFVRDLQTGRDTQLTFSRADDPTAGLWTRYLRPSWLPTGDRLLHGMGRVAAEQLVTRRADAAGDPHTLTDGIYGVVSADGRTLVYITDERGRHRMMRAAVRPDGTIDSPQPVLGADSESNVSDVDLSPDNRLLAYTTPDENGRLVVYVTDFPGAQGRILVDAGATRPRFSRTGDQLFYLKGETDSDRHPFGALMSVRIGANPRLTLGTPARLFDDRTNGLELSTFAVAGNDGFVMSRKVPPPPGKGERVILIENWPSLVARER